MQGYIYTTEAEAITACKQAADYKGLPKSGCLTKYWVDYNYSPVDNFYYIILVDGLEAVLGSPIEFTVTEPED